MTRKTPIKIGRPVRLERAAIAPLASPAPAPIALIEPPALKTQYPHVDAIEDWRAQQSLRLLWDRTYGLEARLRAATATIEQLAARSNAQDLRLASIQRAAGEALATALATSAETAAATGGLSPGEPASGPGSRGEPIIPMSIDPVLMEAAIKASLYFWNSDTRYSYWLSLVVDPWQGGDGKWYHGFDAYFEDRMDPANTIGISSHDLLPLPAVHQDPPPPGYPPGGWT